MRENELFRGTVDEQHFDPSVYGDLVANPRQSDDVEVLDLDSDRDQVKPQTWGT
ncbi:MAG: hypothetical protein ACP5HU_08745 [Phycisphaerae bacterium]